MTTRTSTYCDGCRTEFLGDRGPFVVVPPLSVSSHQLDFCSIQCVIKWAEAARNNPRMEAPKIVPFKWNEQI